MLRYLPELSQEQFDELCISGLQGGLLPVEVADNVLSRRWMCFAIEPERGVLAVSKADDVLTVEAIYAHRWGWFAREFRNVMDRLATDLACNTVESWVFDERLAKAMVRIEAEPVAWQMRWQVRGGVSKGKENGDGR